MSKLERNWQYTEQYPSDTDVLVRARRVSLELGIEPVSRGISSELSAAAVLTNAHAICEIGTGVGVSGLSLLRHRPDAILTSIEIEPEYVREARTMFSAAGIPASRARLVEGDARHIMPRLNLAAYDAGRSMQ